VGLKMHTRETDEKLLMEFVKDQGWSEPDLIEAVERLDKCHKEGLQDYGTTEDCDL
jgi:hypothetical protein